MEKGLTKKIKILTSGSINIKTGFNNSVNTRIWGPVLTPYDETVENIFKLLSAKTDVVEVCPDGEEVTLNLQNYQNDNSKEGRAAREQKATPSKAKKDKEKVVEEPVVEETKVEEPEVTVETVTDETPVVVSDPTEEYEKAVKVDEAVDVSTTYQKRPNNQNQYNKNKRH